MNEEKDDLLAQFENPDISTAQPVAEEAPVETPVEAPVEDAVEAPAVTPVETEEAPVEAPVEASEAPVEAAPSAIDNQNKTVEVEVDPALQIAKDAKESDDEPTLKKNIIFLLVICILIGAFIIFLPTIISLLSGGSY